MPTQQHELPGTERPTIKEIEKAEQAYVDIRNKRMAMTTQEIVARRELIKAMEDHAESLSVDGHGNLVYRFDDELVVLKRGKANVTVKTVLDDSDNDAEED